LKNFLHDVQSVSIFWRQLSNSEMANGRMVRLTQYIAHLFNMNTRWNQWSGCYWPRGFVVDQAPSLSIAHFVSHLGLFFFTLHNALWLPCVKPWLPCDFSLVWFIYAPVLFFSFSYSSSPLQSVSSPGSLVLRQQQFCVLTLRFITNGWSSMADAGLPFFPPTSLSAPICSVNIETLSGGFSDKQILLFFFFFYKKSCMSEEVRELYF